jgi:hypothetical protein
MEQQEQDKMECEEQQAAPSAAVDGAAISSGDTLGGAAYAVPPTAPSFVVPANPQDCELERTIIKDLFSQQQMQLGQTWYLVAVKWFKRWKEYTNYDGDTRHSVQGKPGPIDNTAILDEFNTEGATTTEPRIKRNSMEGYDYELLPENVWLTLYSW